MTHLILLSLSLAASQVLPAQRTATVPTAQIAASWSNPDSPAVLDRVLHVKLTDVPLDKALDSIARAASTVVRYNADDLRTSGFRVSLKSSRTTLGAALHTILDGTAFLLAVDSAGNIAVERFNSPSTRRSPNWTVRISGVVTDGASRLPLSGATLRLVGTGVHAMTSDDGHYAISVPAPGSYRITCQRLGYASLTKATVISDTTSVAILDFALTQIAITLNEVVSTPTGDEQRRTLGNSIATIRADSVVALQAVTTLSDVLTARSAGIQVFTTGGLTGMSPQINVRGQNSATLTNQPIVYVDGARVDNTPGIDQEGGRLNDIVPAEIESIEIVRGPSAATLYGTDAANGVILIKTKRGSSGGPYWTAFGEQGLLSLDKGRFQNSYFPWGHPVGGGTEQQCTLDQVAAAQCVQDSVARFSPLLDPLLTPLGDGVRQNYGAQVSGGSDRLRYFLAGTVEQETGYLRLPTAERSIVANLPGGLGIDVARPNAMSKYGARQNLTYNVASTADISVAASYLTQATRLPFASSIEFGELGPGSRDSSLSYGWLFGIRPYNEFTHRNNEDASHFTGSSTLNWRPVGWLIGRATFGLDHSDESLDNLTLLGDGFPSDVGSVSNNKTSTDLYSADLGATASIALGRSLNARTSIGGQFNRRHLFQTGISGAPLPFQCQTVNCASGTTAFEFHDESIVLGSFVEEGLSLNGRLFLTAALRIDGSNTFGNSFNAVTYPKGSISWVISDEPFWPRFLSGSNIRLRAAIGEAGVEPSATAALTRYTYQQVVEGGQSTYSAFIGQLGNPNLRPERQREVEGGMDVDVLDSRVRVEFTYYDKRSRDALEQIPLGVSIGGLTYTENVGSVRNWGYEGSANFTLLATRPMKWDIALNGSVNHNQLVTLGKGISPIYGQFGYGSIVQGFPLFGLFDHRIASFHADSKGIVEPNDVIVAPGLSYLGPTYPPTQVTATSTLALFNQRVRLSVMFDYRGDFVLFDNPEATRCVNGYCQATSVPGTSLRSQAAAVAYNYLNTVAGYVGDASFVRLREISITFGLPSGLLRPLRIRTADLTLAGRNLALWTRYAGVDPEVVSSANLGTPQNGAYFDNGGLPPAQYWIARVSLGF